MADGRRTASARAVSWRRRAAQDQSAGNPSGRVDLAEARLAVLQLGRLRSLADDVPFDHRIPARRQITSVRSGRRRRTAAGCRAGSSGPCCRPSRAGRSLWPSASERPASAGVRRWLPSLRTAGRTPRDGSDRPAPAGRLHLRGRVQIHRGNRPRQRHTKNRLIKFVSCIWASRPPTFSQTHDKPRGPHEPPQIQRILTGASRLQPRGSLPSLRSASGTNC